MRWSMRPHRTEADQLGHLLYWRQLLEPEGAADIVTQSDCSLLSSLRYRGADVESSSALEKLVRCTQFHTVLRSLAPGWGLHAEVRRRTADPYPTRHFGHPTAALVDTECEEQVRDAHFETDYTFTLTHHLRGMSDVWQRLLWENIPEEHGLRSPTHQFREEVTRFADDLRGLCPTVEVLRGDGLLTYLKSTVSLIEQTVGIPDPPWFLASSLGDTPYTPGSVLTLGDHYACILAVRNNLRTKQAGYPPTTFPGILDLLHDLPLPYRLVQRWLPLSLEQADKELNSYENFYLQQGKGIVTGLIERMTGTASRKRNLAADEEAASVAEARKLLQERVIDFGHLNTQIMLWNTDYSILEEQRQLLEHTMRSARFVVRQETFHSHEAFLSMVPGDFYHNVRRPLIDSMNAARLIATTSVSAGVKWVPHLQGGPWSIGTAKGQTPYGITTHHGDVGDYYMVGPKGSGKSALQALLSILWTQYTSAYGRAQVRAFDKGGSLLCATYALDGVWMDLTPGHCPPLQPLAYIDDEAEYAWAGEWVGDLLRTEQVTVDHEVQGQIWAALRSLRLFPPHRRTLSALWGQVQRPDLRQALSLYTVDGPYGALLDGERDPLPTADWQCFEIEGLLQLPRLLPLVMDIIYRSNRRQLTGAPTLIAYDEVWAVWLIESMLDRMRDEVKTVRRLNGTLAFLTQELFDVHSSSLAHAIVNACMSRFYGANPNALHPEPAKIYTGYGATERQRELIAGLVPKRQYYLTTQAHGNRVVDLAMGPITQAFCGRSRVEELAQIHEVKATAREPFAVAWLRHEGLGDAATLLAEAFEAKGRADEAVATVVSPRMGSGAGSGSDALVVG